MSAEWVDKILVDIIQKLYLVLIDRLIVKNKIF